jgi:hypothetical protein
MNDYNDISVNKNNIRALGAMIPTACTGSSFQYDPPDAIVIAAATYIGNLKERIQECNIANDGLHETLKKTENENDKLHEEINDLKCLHAKALSDYVSLRKELRAYKLLDELSQKYPGGLYDQSEGIAYLRNLLNSTCR